MADRTDIASSDWKNWSAREWNGRLFEHFFRDTGDHTPVSRIAISNNLLRRLVGEAVAPDEAYEAFRTAVVRGLRGRNLVMVAEQAARRSLSGNDEPQAFVYLVVTCYAATHAESGGDGDFRRRLQQFLRLDAPARVDRALPRAWEQLQIWLDRRIETGQSWRRLVLPDPGWRTIIGYSLGLAFPSHRDYRQLVAALADHELLESPPTHQVLDKLSHRLCSFSERFQRNYWEFRSAFDAGRPNLYEFPFWSAIRDAVLELQSELYETANGAVRVLLRLDREEDWRFGVSVFLDGPSPSVGTAVPADDHAIGEFRWVLSDVPNVSTSPAEWVISGHANDSLLSHTPAMQRVLNGRVLLFEPNEDDTWVLALSLPKGDRIRALIHADVIERIKVALTPCGVMPHDSLYHGWFEIEGLSHAQIEAANLATLLHDVDILQPTVDEPSLRLRGGVRTASGWLGSRTCLPEIWTRARCVEITAAIPSDSDEVACIGPSESGTYHLPGPPLVARDLDGECLIRARRSGVVGSRKVRFVSRVLSCDFLAPSDTSNWLCEGGTIDVGPLSAELRTPDEIAVASPCTDSLIWGRDRTGQYCENNASVSGLIEVLAGRSLRRGILNSSEVVKWFYEILRLGQKSEVWAVVRSWIEAGVLDQFIHRSWRCTSYRARRPRFVITITKGELPIRGVLMGLAPNAIEEAVRRAAEHRGAEIERCHPVRSCLPAPLVLFTADLDTIATISRSAAIGEPEVVRPIGQCVCSFDEVERYRRELRKNHLPCGEWNWVGNYFDASEHTAEPGVKRFRREDAPDSYVVRFNGSEPTHTFSKTWALLIGSKANRQAILTADRGSRCILMRRGVHLPLPVGRWATATTGVCPGEIDRDEYEYRFTGRAARDGVLNTLWKPAVSEDSRRRVERLDWMCRAERYRGNLVAVPTWVNELLNQCGTELNCQHLTRAHVISRRLLPQLLSVANAIRSSSH